MKTIENFSLYLALFVSLQTPPPIGAQTITNEQVVIAAARDGVENNFEKSSLNNIVIKVSEDEISRPISAGLAEGFKNIGVNVIGNDQGISIVQYVQCDILGFDFKYKNGASKGFLRRRMLKRDFSAILKLTVLNSDDRSISDIKDITIQYQDQIDPKLADFIKSRTITALSPPFPSSKIQRIIEPLIVTAAVGGLVFLFFANR